MASSIARGCVRTTKMAMTMTTMMAELRNMVATLQMIHVGWQRHAALVYRLLLWFWTSMLWLIDTCQNKVSADQYHVTISQAPVYSSSRSRVFWGWLLTKCWFSIGSRAHVRLTCWKQGRVVRKPVNASPGLTLFYLNYNFFIQMCFVFFFAAFF